MNDVKSKARKESQAELAAKKKALERAHAERIRELKRQAYGVTASADNITAAPTAAIADVAAASDELGAAETALVVADKKTAESDISGTHGRGSKEFALVPVASKHDSNELEGAAMALGGSP